MQHFEIDADWIRDKFGIEVIGPKQPAAALSAQLEHDPFSVRE